MRLGEKVGLQTGEARLVMLDDNSVDLPPAPFMLYVRNDDKPGMIGKVGTILGASGVNIDDMDVVARLRTEDGNVSVHALQG